MVSQSFKQPAAVTEVDSQEVLNGELVQGACQTTLSIIGAAVAIEQATLQLTGCDDDFMSGATVWFMSQLLPQEVDLTRGMVWLVTDVYYVIEGEMVETAVKEIGRVGFMASNNGDQPSVFELQATINPREE